MQSAIFAIVNRWAISSAHAIRSAIAAVYFKAIRRSCSAGAHPDAFAGTARLTCCPPARSRRPRAYGRQTCVSALRSQRLLEFSGLCEHPEDRRPVLRRQRKQELPGVPGPVGLLRRSPPFRKTSATALATRDRGCIATAKTPDLQQWHSQPEARTERGPRSRIVRIRLVGGSARLADSSGQAIWRPANSGLSAA